MMHEVGTILDHSSNPYHSPAIMVSANYEGATTGAPDLYRNNPLAHGGIYFFVFNMVGKDIFSPWRLDNDKQREELEELWAQSVSEMNFYLTPDFGMFFSHRFSHGHKKHVGFNAYLLINQQR